MHQTPPLHQTAVVCPGFYVFPPLLFRLIFYKCNKFYFNFRLSAFGEIQQKPIQVAISVVRVWFRCNSAEVYFKL